MPEDMLGAALYGFHGAKVRYDSHQYDDQPVDVIVPLAEAMWWATSLDEALWSEADYQRRRDADHAGQHVRAARFARNRINHQLILAIERAEGARFPLTFPMRFFEFLWLPLDRLPESRWADADGENLYEQHLAGRPVRLTLHHAAGWFAAQQNEPTSPLYAGGFGHSPEA